MSFFCRVSGLSLLRDRVRGSVTWEGLRAAWLLLHIKSRLVRGSRHLVVSHRKCFSMSNGEEVLRETYRTHWRHYIPQFRKTLVSLEELEQFHGEREVQTSLLGLLPLRPIPR